MLVFDLGLNHQPHYLIMGNLNKLFDQTRAFMCTSALFPFTDAAKDIRDNTLLP